MTKVVGLYGKAETGKTMTLNLLIDILESVTTGHEMPIPQSVLNNRRKSFIYKGLNIGIGTWGDNEDEVRRNCGFFQDNNCDIVFSATRTKGRSRKALLKYAEENSTSVIWIKKRIADSDYESAALEQANKLFNLML